MTRKIALENLILRLEISEEFLEIPQSIIRFKKCLTLSMIDKKVCHQFNYLLL